MNKIEHTTRGFANIISNPTYISYGFLGLSSVILGYYTLFDNNIDKVVPEQPSTPMEQPSTPMEQPQESILQPTQELPAQSPMQGGKKNKKKTRKSKK